MAKKIATINGKPITQDTKGGCIQDIVSQPQQEAKTYEPIIRLRKDWSKFIRGNARQ